MICQWQTEQSLGVMKTYGISAVLLGVAFVGLVWFARVPNEFERVFSEIRPGMRADDAEVILQKLGACFSILDCKVQVGVEINAADNEIKALGVVKAGNIGESEDQRFWSSDGIWYFMHKQHRFTVKMRNGFVNETNYKYEGGLYKRITKWLNGGK